MRWEDERYVRVYTRDTVDWLALSLEAQGLLALLLRKSDRAGVVKLGRHGKRGVAAAIGHAHRWETIEPALEELLADGVVVLTTDGIVYRNFIQAQEALQSDTARKRTQRERDRDKALAAGYPEATSQMMVDEMARRAREPPPMSQNVTETPDVSQNVTNPAEMSRPVVTQDGHAGKVTPNRAVPCLPCRAEPPTTRVTADAVSAPGALSAPRAVVVGAMPGRRVEDRPAPRPEPPALTYEPDSLDERMKRVWREERGSELDWKRSRDEPHMRDILRLAKDDWGEVERVMRRALQLDFPRCLGLKTLVEHWPTYAGRDPPKPDARGRLLSTADRGPVGDRSPT